MFMRRYALDIKMFNIYYVVTRLYLERERRSSISKLINHLESRTQVLRKLQSQSHFRRLALTSLSLLVTSIRIEKKCTAIKDVNNARIFRQFREVFISYFFFFFLYVSSRIVQFSECSQKGHPILRKDLLRFYNI